MSNMVFDEIRYLMHRYDMSTTCRNRNRIERLIKIYMLSYILN